LSDYIHELVLAYASHEESHGKILYMST